MMLDYEPPKCYYKKCDNVVLTWDRRRPFYGKVDPYSIFGVGMVCWDHHHKEQTILEQTHYNVAMVLFGCDEKMAEDFISKFVWGC